MSAKSTRPISRPVFLNLLKIKLPMNAVASITHRLSGMYVFFITLPMSLALLFLSKKSETTFTYLKAHLNELNFLSFFVYINIVFIIAITIFIIFSKKNEPKVFPEKFSKKYILKYPRL